jgi:hypothetical protein
MGRSAGSGVVVHGELMGMGTLAQLLHLLVLESDPVVDEVLCEHASSQEVILIRI